MLSERIHHRTVYLDPAFGIKAAPTPYATPKPLIDCSPIDTTTNLHVKQELTAISPTIYHFTMHL
jgi:hypothetical protein